MFRNSIKGVVAHQFFSLIIRGIIQPTIVACDEPGKASACLVLQEMQKKFCTFESEMTTGRHLNGEHSLYFYVICWIAVLFVGVHRAQFSTADVLRQNKQLCELSGLIHHAMSDLCTDRRCQF